MSKKTSEASFAKPHNGSDRQGGFTLVEIMVGLAIGMIATLIIMQVLSVFEAQKRVTTGVADAQTNGSIALYNIAREIQLAGYPLLPVADSPLECATLTLNGDTGTNNYGVISPVAVTDGGGGVSDSITIRYGNSQMGGIPTAITASPTANDVPVVNSLGCQTGDIAVITNGPTCAMTSVTAVPATTTITLANIDNVITGANLSCLGNWESITFAVNGGTLERNGVPLVTGIVNLQAQYGISASANSNQVTQWKDAIGDWATTSTTPTVANRNRIKAIRIAVVARNDRLEAGNVTTAINIWTGTASAQEVDLSADANWQRYRYRVFETIIPLRNVIWAKDTL